MLKEAQDDIEIADRGRHWTDNHVPAPGGWEGIIGGVVVPGISEGKAANAALAVTAVAKRVSTFVVMYHAIF